LRGWPIPPVSVDVGKIPLGKRHNVEFSLVNTSERPVEVVGARSSCACMASIGERRKLEPNSENRFLVVLNPSKAGTFQHGMLYYLDHKVQNTFVVQIHGVVKEN
jgi:hypothetical protein